MCPRKILHIITVTGQKEPVPLNNNSKNVQLNLRLDLWKWMQYWLYFYVIEVFTYCVCHDNITANYTCAQI